MVDASDTGHEMKALRRSERAAARVCRSSASNRSAITSAAQRKRTVRFTAIALRPAAVSETRRRRPWLESSRRLTQPPVSSAATIAPIDCGVIASARAKSAVVEGPSVSKRLSTRSCGYGSVWPGRVGVSTASARARRRNATVISRSSSASSSGVGRFAGTERILPCGPAHCQVNFYWSFRSLARPGGASVAGQRAAVGHELHRPNPRFGLCWQAAPSPRRS